MRGPFLVLVCVSLWLTGCAEPPRRTAEPSPKNEFELVSVPEAGPFPDNYRIIVATEMRSTLRDPYSVRDVAITRPFPVKARLRGWLVCASANAKNAFGAYTGQQLYAYLISRGYVLYTFPETKPDSVFPRGTTQRKIEDISRQISSLESTLALDLCAQAINRGITAFERAPELDGRG
jgi:hypothetical protein